MFCVWFPALLETIFIVRSHVRWSGGRPTLLATGLLLLVSIMSLTHCAHFVTCTLHHGTLLGGNARQCKPRSVRVVQEQADTMIAARQPPFIIILSVSLIHVSLKTTTILPPLGIKHKTTPSRERPVLGFPTFNSSPEQLFVPYHSQDLQMVAIVCFVESVMLTPIMAAEGIAMEMRNTDAFCPLPLGVGGESV